MAQADDHTRTTLRQLKASGKLSSPDGIDDETARELLKTPPSTSLFAAKKHSADAAGGFSGSSGGGLLATGGSASSANETIAVLVRNMEDDCHAFTAALEDNTRLAKEQMQRSLLQLFEDTAREKLADTFLRGSVGVQVAGVASSQLASSSINQVPGSPAQSPLAVSAISNFRAGSGAAAVRAKLQSPLGVASGLRTVSRRPVDRGLDKRDAPSDLVIPEAIREQISVDIFAVVDHELKRWVSAITGDIDKILQHALGVRDRMTKMEEEVLQRQVENRMQADQLTQYANEMRDVRAEVEQLRTHNHDKDQQMDILRDQVARRNAALDETRVRFRKEVMRYKARLQELEMELETLSSSKHGGGRGGGRGALGERRSSFPDMIGSGANGEDPEAKEEILAAAEQAVKETTERFNEEIKQLHIRYAKEKKAILAEMHAKISERDAEIMRLKEKLKEALQSSKIDE